MAILGEKLIKPEDGWKRINLDEFMETIDDNIKNITGYGKTEVNSYKTHSYIYKFTGTKIRLISTLYTIPTVIFPDMPADEINDDNTRTYTSIPVKAYWVGSVFIDCEFAGRIYSEFENEDKDGQTLTLMFEKTDLLDGEHLLNVSIYSPFIERKLKNIFDLEFIDIDKEAKFDCYTYNEDYTRNQLIEFINLNYNELVNDFPNKVISCDFFFDGIYIDRLNTFDLKIISFPYYLNNFKLIDIKDIPKTHPARINTYGTIYDLDEIFEICEDLSSPFANKLCKFSFDSIMISRRLQYSMADNIDLEKDFYLYQEKVENEDLGKVEVNVVPNSIVIKTKNLVELKNEGFFSGITYFRGNSADTSSIFVERILYSKDNINWYTYNKNTKDWELVELDQINSKGIVIFGDSYNKATTNNPSLSEYKKFFDGVTEIGLAIGFSPNPEISNISTYYPNINYCFLSFNQNISNEDIYKGFYYLSYPMTSIADKLYFIPIPSKNSEFGEFSFLSSHFLTYQKNANFEKMFIQNKYMNNLYKILWRYNYFSEYSSTDLCHFLLSQPIHQNSYKALDPEYSEYLKFIKSDPKFKESFLFYEGIYDRHSNSTGSTTYDFEHSYSSDHFKDWIEKYEKAGAKYYSTWTYNYMPRFRLTFRPILNKNNLIKNNWRCIITNGNSI